MFALILSAVIEYSPMTSTAKPLTHCPVCRYDLTGLPKTHACPECGFEYDESMRVWEAGGLELWQIMTFIASVFEFSIIAAAILVWLWFTGRQWLSFCGLVTYIIIMIAMLWRMRQRSCTVISDQGITFQDRSGQIHSWPWSEVEIPPPSFLGIALSPGQEINHSNAKLESSSKIAPRIGRRVSLCSNAFIWITPSGKPSVWDSGVKLPIEFLGWRKCRKAKKEIYEKWQQATIQ